MLIRRTAWSAVLVLAMAVAGLAAEPEPPKKDPAPDELPTHLVKVLRTSNKAQTNRYVLRVYDIHNVNPYELFRWVRRAAQIEEGGYFFFGKPEADGTVKSGKIVVTLPEYMLPGMDEMMKVIDREGLNSGAGDKWYFFPLNYRHLSDSGFVDMLSAIRGGSGTVVADTDLNWFLAYVPQSKVDNYKFFKDRIDLPPPQVMIEAAVYEIGVDNESRLGLDYVAWKNGPGRNLFAAGLFGEREKISALNNANPLLNTGVPGGTFGLPGHGFHNSGSNFAWFLDVPSAFFDFLVVKNKARVMTSAKLAARNTYAASLSAGDTILYYKTQVATPANAGVRAANLPLDQNATSTTFPDNRTLVSTQTARLVGTKAGVTLTITPLIGEKEIDLDVTTSVVSHVGFDDKGTPTLVNRCVDSKITCRDGQEVVLGGFSREVFVQRADKMPILGSLPFIGYLFGGESNTTERRQVVIVLTPHVIQDYAALQYPGTRIDAAYIQSQVLGKEAAPVPHTETGFDQWLLDSGK